MSLVEVLVASVVLMVVMGGVAGMLTSALGLTQQNRSRVVAANLASADIDLARSVTFTELEAAVDAGAVREEVNVDGQDYTVTRTVRWVTLDTDGSACNAPGGEHPTHLEVVVDVSWPTQPDGRPPVRSQTIIAPAVGDLDPTRGHIGVRLVDRDLEPVAGQRVWARRGAFEETFGYTDANGCVFFGFLTPGEWTIDVGEPGDGMVARMDNPPQPRLPVPFLLAPGDVQTVTLEYDAAATLAVAVEGEHGGVLPAGLALTVENLNPTHRQAHAWEPDASGRSHIGGLFPYRSGYSAWAGEPVALGGSCLPEGARSEPADVDPGVTSEVLVPVATLHVWVGKVGHDGPKPGVPVVARRLAGANCGDDPFELLLGTTDADGVIEAAVPYGDWRFIAGSGEPTAQAQKELRLDPGAGGPYTLELRATPPS